MGRGDRAGGGRPPPRTQASLRESQRNRRRKEAEERVEQWTPRTELGRMVAEGRLTSLHDALETHLPLREPEIVDILLPDVLDEVLDIHMVQRMTDSGRRVRFAVTTVVGNQNGFIGLGRVSGKQVRPTIQKSIDHAKLHIVEILRGSGSWECGYEHHNSLPFEVFGRAGSTRVTLKPAPPGVGLVVNKTGKTMLRMAGIKDVWSFTKGQTQTIYNYASATMVALKSTRKLKVSDTQQESQSMIQGAVG